MRWCHGSIRDEARDDRGGIAQTSYSRLLCEALQDRLGKEPIAFNVVVSGAPEWKQGQSVAMSFERYGDQLQEF